MRFANSLLVGLLALGTHVLQANSQTVYSQGRHASVREGNRKGVVTEFNIGMHYGARQRRIKGNKEVVSNEDKKGNKEVVSNDDKKDKMEVVSENGEKGAKVEKIMAKESDDKGAKKEKKEKLTKEEMPGKEAMKEADKLEKEDSSSVPPTTDATTVAPSVAPEGTTSPAPTDSPTCVECDDVGR